MSHQLYLCPIGFLNFAGTMYIRGFTKFGIKGVIVKATGTCPESALLAVSAKL